MSKAQQEKNDTAIAAEEVKQAVLVTRILEEKLKLYVSVNQLVGSITEGVTQGIQEALKQIKAKS